MLEARRLLVLYPSAYLGSTPCVRNFVLCLAREGYFVDVVTAAGDHETTCLHPRARVMPMEQHGGFSSFLSHAATSSLDLKDDLAGVVAIDRNGLLAARALGTWRRWRIPLVYMSTEIFVPPLFTGWKHRVANWLEGRATRFAKLIVSPSSERAQLHSRMFGVSSSRTRVFPNAPEGPAHAAPRTDVLARRCGTDPARPHILYAGTLSGPNRIKELLQDARRWPAEWVLVLHSRLSLGTRDRARFEFMARKAACTVVITDSPCSPSELRDLAGGADVGIALYREDGSTFQTVGTASGKIAEYLHAGVPVVMPPLESLKPLAAAGAGRTARVDGEGLCTAITELLAAGMSARSEAARCFDKHFSVERAWSQLRPGLFRLFGRPRSWQRDLPPLPPGRRPAVSIVVPVYNRADVLKRTIDRVFEQKWTDWELVAVDDCSTDHSVELLDSMAGVDRRIRVVRQQRNRGAQAARNAGIRAARGEWIAFLDSDDEWMPDHLSSRLARASAFERSTNQPPAVVYGPYQKMTGGRVDFKILEHPEGNIYARLLLSFFGITSSLMIRRDILAGSGLFDESLSNCHEYDLTVRLARHFPFAAVSQITVHVHRDAGARTVWRPEGSRQFQNHCGADIRRLLGPPMRWRKIFFTAGMYRNSGNWRAAAREYIRVIRENPLHPGAWSRLFAMPLLDWRHRSRS